MTQEDPKEAAANEDPVDNGAENEEQDEDVAAEDGSEQPDAAAKKKKKKSEFLCHTHLLIACCCLVHSNLLSVVYRLSSNTQNLRHMTSINSTLFYICLALQKRRRRRRKLHRATPRAHHPKKQKAACSTKEVSPTTTSHTVRQNRHLYPLSISFAVKKLQLLPNNNNHLLICPPFLKARSNPIHSNPTPIASPPKNSVTTNASSRTYTINSVTHPRSTVKYVTMHNPSSNRVSNWSTCANVSRNAIES